MKRRLFNVLAMLSLLLCVAVLVSWVHSHRSYDAVGFWPFPSSPRVYGVITDEGTICFAVLNEGNGDRRWAWRHSKQHDLKTQVRVYAGFVLHRDPKGYVVGLPHLVLCLLTAVAPALWLARRRRQPGAGLCRQCGYDLRATPDRCPECGAVAGTPTESLPSVTP
jgi:hypothetical protein